MNYLFLAFALVVGGDEQVKTPSAADNKLIPELKVFEPMVGKTFRGEFADSTPKKPNHDVSKWERALNGKGVRILHSVNDGTYGGETMVMWDAKEKKIAFWYFTTAGFYTTGHIEMEGNTWTSIEKVAGNANGITEVNATSIISDDGTLQVSSKYLQNGSWVKGHEIKYLPSADAKVIFK